MLASRIILKNWRNFKQADIRLKNRVFVVGPNASGKSNLLDALRFLRDIAKTGGGLQKAVEDRGGLSKIRCLSARQDPKVEIEIFLSDFGSHRSKWRYSIGIVQDVRGKQQGKAKLAYERIYRYNNCILDRSKDKDKDKEDPLRLTQTHLEQINENKSFREISNFLSEILYLHLVPQLVRNPNSFSGPGVPGDPFGRNFLERVAKTPEKTRRARLSKIEKALQAAVPQLKELSLKKDVEGRPHLEVIYTHWRSQGAKQQEDQFSDGTLRLLGLLWTLFEANGILLLEEPELSLHASIVQRIPKLMYEIQRKDKKRLKQIILSTHSCDLLSDHGISAEEVIMLAPNQEGTEIKAASSIREIRALLNGGMSIGDAIHSRTKPKNIHQLTLGI